MNLPEAPWRLERKPDAPMLPRLRVADANDRTVCLIPCDGVRLTYKEAEAVGKAITRLPYLLFALENLLAEIKNNGDMLHSELLECADMVREEIDVALQRNVRV